MDFVKKYDYLPELLHAKRWEEVQLFMASGYNADEDKLDYMPSDYDIYKTFFSRFTIETDRKQNKTWFFRHISHHFSQNSD